MENSTKSVKKASSVRHTGAIALDRSKRHATAPPAERIEQLLGEIVEPATFDTLALYQKLGLRARVLTLPVMVAFVLTLIWRQLGSVALAVRMPNEEGMLWQPLLKVTQQAVNDRKVTQQAVNDRLREMKAELFENILNQALPLMHQRQTQRTRPVPAQMQTAVRLPVKIWYGEDSAAHDQSWWGDLVGVLEEGSLSLFEMGFVNYERYQQLSEIGRFFVSRVKSNMVYEKLEQLTNGVG